MVLEPTIEGKGRRRRRVTQGHERRGAMDMGRHNQGLVATKFQGVFASHTQCPIVKKCPTRNATR